MKKFYLLVLGTLLSAGVAEAKVQTPSEALQRALEQLQGGHSMAKTMVSPSEPQLTSIEKSADGTALCYVYDTNGGFIIACADDRAHSVLGYSDEGDYSEALKNPAFQGWINSCKEALTWLSNQPEDSNATTSRAKATSVSSDLKDEVFPLLGNTKWDQTTPYNGACPEANGKKALTGCVATAAAQVMRYHKWPEKATAGIHTNTKWKSNFQGGYKTIDYSTVSFEWDSFLDTYKKNKYTADDSMRIANLMVEIGCAANMNYFDHDTESGTNMVNLVYALCTYFGYDKNIEFLERMFYTSDQWTNTLKKELSEDRPVIFTGYTSNGSGHCFVLDGYNSDGFFHVNWGWSGNGNGYFDIDLLDSKGGSFKFKEQALINIKPDKEYNSVGKPKLVLEEKMNFDEDKKKVALSIRNTSVVPFTGTISLVLTDKGGNEISRIDSSYAQAPIEFDENGTNYKWDLEALGAVNCTDTVYLKLKYKDGTEEKFFNRPVAMLKWPEYVPSKNEWAPTSEKPTIEYVGMYANRIGYRPKMKLKCSWPAEKDKELDYQIKVQVYQDGKNCCNGMLNIYLQPGQDSIYIVNLDVDGSDYKEGTDDKFTYKDLGVGSCVFYIYGYYYNFKYKAHTFVKEETFNMFEEKDSVLTYSKIKLDKTEYNPGEQITASFTVKNTGGYTEPTYYFTSKNKEEEFHYSKSISIANGEEKTLTFMVDAPYTPGKYTAEFYIDVNTSIGKACSYTVVDATGISEVSGSQTTTKKSIFNLAGQRINAPQKGINIIGGKKYMK